MAPVAKKVATPGSYNKPAKKVKKKLGRPPTPKDKRKRQRGEVKHRSTYTEDDIVEAIRLVREEDFSIAASAAATNKVKLHVVPRMTLSDCLWRETPQKKPALGRPIELSPAVEATLVKCLKMCATFQYPMKKRDLQDLVQSYCVEHSIDVRWV